MSFRFDHPDEPVDDNVRRVAKAEFDRAIAEVSESGFEVHETVRGVRRRLKRIRAILKLIRPVFGEYARENRLLRETGAEVSALRDAAALVEAADRLAKAGGRGSEAAGALERVRRALAERAAAHVGALERDAFLTELRVKLRDARVRSELWEFDGAGRRAVVPGFVATYRRARRGLKRVKATRTEESFHEWRKAVKHHWVQLSLLRGLMPPFAEPRRARAKELAETLGDLQNLCVLRNTLGKDDIGVGEEDKSAVARLLAPAIADLTVRAVRLGRPLFAERPQAVRRRWNAYWAEWRATRRFG